MKKRPGPGISVDWNGIKSGESALITETQRFSVHDGPGIRTLVFFKGCPLRCQWCQNPETQARTQEIMFTAQECISCLQCVVDCTEGCNTASPDGSLVYDRAQCSLCGDCLSGCYAGARKLVAHSVSVDEVFELVMRDAVFYRNSGGGVTLGGGEVTMYPAFAAELLRRVRTQGVHTAIETCGHCRWEDLDRILEHTDLVLYDIKHPNPERHREVTGVTNRLILDNLRRVAAARKPLIIRFRWYLV